MTATIRTNPNQINPVDDTGAPVADGTYVLKVIDGRVTELTVETGGGGTEFDRRWEPGPSETGWYDFTDSAFTTDATRVDSSGGASRVTYTEDDHVLSVLNTGGDTTNYINALMVDLTDVGGSLSTGDAFITCLSLNSNGGNYAFGGLLFSDGTTHGAGNQVVATTHFGGSSKDHFLRAYTNFTTIGSSVDALSTVTLATPWFVRLVFLGGTTWRRDLSTNGRDWLIGAATLTKSMTATHVGVLSSSWGTSTDSVASYFFLRRVSGIT